GGAVAEPRWEILRVTSWNALCPSPVKSKVTFGWFEIWSKFCSGFVISVPLRAGRSLSTNCGEEESSVVGRVSDGLVGAAATRVPCGTERITVPGGCVFGFLNWR